MVSSNTAVTQAQPSSSGFRWMQLVMGIVCMAMIANLQYGWTLFVDPIDGAHHWGRAAIQFAFTIFVVTETWLVPVEAWFVDKYGPRLVVLIGGILCAIGWAINAQATTLNGYYLGMIVAGIGAGGVYGTCVGNALKWFPDKRGLAAGITAAGFGAGSALTVAPIQAMIKDSGFQTTFLYFGLGQGIIIVLLAFFLLGVAVTIVVEGSLSFLGLGVPPPISSWGSMIGEGRESLEVAPQLAFIPAIAMFLTVLAFNLIGDTIRALTDPRQGAL